MRLRLEQGRTWKVVVGKYLEGTWKWVPTGYVYRAVWVYEVVGKRMYFETMVGKEALAS